MNNRTYFIIIVIYTSTIIWGIIGYAVYQSAIDEHSFLQDLPPFDRISSEPLLVKILILTSSYLLSIAIGFLFYAETRFWKDL